MLLLAVPSVMGTTGVGAPAWVGYALLAIEAAGFLSAGWVHRRARRPSVVRCDEHGVTIVDGGSERKIPVEAIESAIVIADARDPRIELRLRADDALTLRYETLDAAREARQALRLEGRGRTERLPLYTESERRESELGGGVLGVAGAAVPAMMLGLFLGPIGLAMGVSLMLAAAFGAGSFFRSLLANVTIGADGVAFGTNGFPGTDFVPYRDIARFEITLRDLRKLDGANVLSLVRTNGERENIGTFRPSDHALASSMLERLTAALEEARERGAQEAAPLADLDARGEAVPHWLARLQKLARPQDGYRAESIDDASVAAMLGDANLTNEQRVGAAMLLRIRDQEGGRDRVRIASESCADPKTRAALQAIAEGEADEEALERAARHVR